LSAARIRRSDSLAPALGRGCERLVLSAERIDRVPGKQLAPRRLLQYLAQDRRVEIAHLHHFLSRHPLGHQLLLEGRDLIGIDGANQRGQPLPHTGDRCPCMQILDDPL
jgi:hypothetical protein